MLKNAPEHTANDFEVESLKRWYYLIRSKKETYASFFNKLCNHCGLECRIAKGYVKGQRF